jgi:hypothetical protein
LDKREAVLDAAKKAISMDHFWGSSDQWRAYLGFRITPDRRAAGPMERRDTVHKEGSKFHLSCCVSSLAQCRGRSPEQLAAAQEPSSFPLDDAHFRSTCRLRLLTARRLRLSRRHTRSLRVGSCLDRVSRSNKRPASGGGCLRPCITAGGRRASLCGVRRFLRAFPS